MKILGFLFGWLIYVVVAPFILHTVTRILKMQTARLSSAITVFGITSGSWVMLMIWSIASKQYKAQKYFGYAFIAVALVTALVQYRSEWKKSIAAVALWVAACIALFYLYGHGFVMVFGQFVL